MRCSPALGSPTGWPLTEEHFRAWPRAAWTYQQPSRDFAPIAGAIAVMPAAVDRCTVDGEEVIAQPGGFYGGWITSWIVGPFKGIPGSMGW
jgi:hypothetical protein